MNERIQEIAKQSGVVYDWDPGTSGPEVYFDRQEDFEKFAELLVLECAKISKETCNELKADETIQMPALKTCANLYHVTLRNKLAEQFDIDIL